jgi:hypothetical protein
MKKLLITLVALSALPSIGSAAPAVAMCDAQTIKWGKGNSCQAEALPAPVGSTRSILSTINPFDSRGQGGSIMPHSLNVGNAKIQCMKNGQFKVVDSKCAANGAATNSQDTLDALRVKGVSDTAIRPIEITDGEYLAQAGLKKAEKTNGVTYLTNDIGEWKTDVEVVIDQAGQTIKQSVGIPQYVGQGKAGTLISEVVPEDVKAIVLQASADFNAGDGSIFKYADFVLCAPVCSEPMQVSMAQAKGGSRGHYWGYSATGVKLFRIPLQLPKGMPFTVNLVKSHYLQNATVTASFEKSDSPLTGQSVQYFPQTTAGSLACLAEGKVQEEVVTNYLSKYEAKFHSIVKTSLAEHPSCATGELKNTTIYTRLSDRWGNPAQETGSKTGDLQKTLTSYPCPAGTTKKITGNAVACYYR